MAVAVMKMELPKPTQPFEGCVGVSVSNWFDIESGCEGDVRIHELPEGVCLCVEEYIYGPCCCWVKCVPVPSECGCSTCIDGRGTICLPSGRYHLTLTDKETGLPFVPDPNDILVTVHHKICK